MEWIMDPTAWLGLLTLVLLEIVLGIDNLIFIAILADKLPPEQRNRARIIGLSMAMLLRLLLLASISWLVGMTAPVANIYGLELSWRDFVMLGGGIFLLYKATIELHERLEGDQDEQHGKQNYAGFWAVIAQIVVLDAVFSIDSVVTAIGMVDHLSVMMVAVVIAMLVMMLASKPLTTFVNAHPTVVMLCLGFLLMIGFSLIADGVGFHIPKGYLYAAIGFSVLIEGFNQLAQRNRRKAFAGRMTLRDRTAEAVFKLLGGRVESAEVGHDIVDMVGGMSPQSIFQPSEQTMIRGVLSLGERSVKAIMTPRLDIHWIDLADSREQILEDLMKSPYSRLVVARDGGIDAPLGVVEKKHILRVLLSGQQPDFAALTEAPLYVPESISVLNLLERFKHEATQIALVVDEFGTFEGIATMTDVMASIAGELPEEHEDGGEDIQQQDEDNYLVDGRTSIEDLERMLGIEAPDDSDYHTAAGMALEAFGSIPAEAEQVETDSWRITVLSMDGNRIERMQFTRLPQWSEAQE